MAEDYGSKTCQTEAFGWQIQASIVYLVAAGSPVYSSLLASKFRSYDQTAAAQQKAIRFAADVLQDSDLADDIADESVESYALRKGVEITDNPSQRRRTADMANGNDLSKSDLQDCVDQATDILMDAYTPEASREDLAAAIGDALDALSGDYDDTADGDDDDDDGSNPYDSD